MEIKTEKTFFQLLKLETVSQGVLSNKIKVPLEMANVIEDVSICDRCKMLFYTKELQIENNERLVCTNCLKLLTYAYEPLYK